MLSKEDFAVIKALNRRGVYQKDIAEQLGVHPKTVSRALKRGAAPPGRGNGGYASWTRTSRQWIDCCQKASGTQ